MKKIMNLIVLISGIASVASNLAALDVTVKNNSSTKDIWILYNNVKYRCNKKGSTVLIPNGGGASVRVYLSEACQSNNAITNNPLTIPLKSSCTYEGGGTTSRPSGSFK